VKTLRSSENLKNILFNRLAIGFCAAIALFGCWRLGAQTLPFTNNPQLWLKADAGVATNAGGLVTNWADQSGKANDAAPPNGNNAVPARTIYRRIAGWTTLRAVLNLCSATLSVIMKNANIPRRSEAM